jgi:hypothetical protein
MIEADLRQLQELLSRAGNDDLNGALQGLSAEKLNEITSVVSKVNANKSDQTKEEEVELSTAIAGGQGTKRPSDTEAGIDQPKRPKVEELSASGSGAGGGQVQEN